MCAFFSASGVSPEALRFVWKRHPAFHRYEPAKVEANQSFVWIASPLHSSQ